MDIQPDRKVTPMIVKCFTVNFMKENTYIVYDETKECVIIDCGCHSSEEKEELRAFISDNGLTPKHILCTHFHLDHTFGNKFAKETYGLDAETSSADGILSEMMHYQVLAFGMDDADVDIPTPVFTLSDGVDIRFGNSSLKVIATPGHSPGGVSFYSESEGILFAGDTLMREAVGATNLPGSRKPKLVKSIKQALFTLPDDTRVLPGHGAETTIGHEKVHNPIVTEQN